MEAERPVRSASLRFRVILSLAFLAAVAVIVCMSVFRIRYVSVKGNYHISAEEVMALAGLDKGGLYFTVNEASVRRGIESNPYLELKSFQKSMPDSVTVTVRERTAAACVAFQNRRYILDTTGFVIEEAGDDTKVPIELKGVTVRDARPGETVTLSSQQHLNSYRTVAEELGVQGMLGRFRELNLTDVKNIYLVTVDGENGMVATLGTDSDIRAKLLTLGGVLQYMDMYSLNPGSLDVSVPGYCTYTPN